MNVKQISIRIENRPGTILNIVEALAENDMHIRALTCSASNEIGILRLLVDNVLWAASLLKNLGYDAMLKDVVLINVSGVTGGFSRVLEVMKDYDINVTYTYSIMSRKNQGMHETFMIFEVDDYAKTASVMAQKNIKILNQQELADL